MSPSIQSTSEIPSYIVGNGYMVSKQEKMWKRREERVGRGAEATAEKKKNGK